MKINRWMILSIAAVIIICTVKVYAGNLSMTTYYPAPTGYYDSMKINKTLVMPCYNPASAARGALPGGAVWVEDSSCTN
jgi:hypothetical protein